VADAPSSNKVKSTGTLSDCPFVLESLDDAQFCSNSIHFQARQADDRAGSDMQRGKRINSADYKGVEWPHWLRQPVSQTAHSAARLEYVASSMAYAPSQLWHS
jgi:hypothetical protein